MINYTDRPPLPPMTVAEYFAYDRSSQRRHEYVYGAVRPMAGGTLIAYCALESLRTYVILESRRKWATVMRRADGEWIRDEQSGGRIRISIPQGALDIPFDEIYSGLDLPELVVREVPDSNSDAARRYPEPSPDA